MTGTRTSLKFHLTLLFVAIAMAGSLHSHAQSKETMEMLKVQPEGDPEKDEPVQQRDTADNNYCCLIKKHGYARYLYADLGGSDLISKIDNTTSHAMGLTWAVSAQLAYKIHSYNPNHRAFFSGGLEVRNYNATASSKDHLGATAYDNLHYWYAGLPLIYQVLNTHYTPGRKHQLRYYGQAGVTLGVMMKVNNVYSDQGTNATYDLSKHYSVFMLQPVLSAGVTYKTPTCIYMLGPYAGYTVTNINTNSGISEHIFSFGLRLTTLFLRS